MRTDRWNKRLLCTISTLLSYSDSERRTKKWRGPNHDKREMRVYNGVWGRSPRRGSGQSPWLRGQGASPHEAESFLGIRRANEGTNWPHIRVLNERNCILLLDSNETDGLIVMNVNWSHFFFGTPQKTAS